MGYLDYRKQAVRELGINPSDCSFNPGVFVADIEEWKKQKITVQLEKWMSVNVKWVLHACFVRNFCFSFQENPKVCVLSLNTTPFWKNHISGAD